MFRQINVSAPSKVILHGEHAVVYGKSAVAASLDLRTRMCLTPITNENLLQVDFPDVGVKETWTSQSIKKGVLCQKPKTSTLAQIDEPFLEKIQSFVDHQCAVMDDLQKASLTCFFYLYAVICEHFVPMHIKVESEIPLGAGLGSSAALSVCLAAGLCTITRPDGSIEDKKEICDLALLSEMILHGRPSGIDNAVSTYGGFVHFNQGKILPLEPPKNVTLRIVLVNTKSPRKTKDQVEKVRVQKQRHPLVIDPILEAIDGVSQSFLDKIKLMESHGDSQEDYQHLNDLVTYNHKLLNTLGVSHPSLEEVIAVAQSCGLSAKLTGAGGGGFAFIMLPPFVLEPTICEVKEKLSKKGFTCYETNLGVNGVRVQIDNSNSECISQ